MKPSDAEALLENGDYLTGNERTAYLFLLRRSDNVDCRIPRTVAPRLALVSRRCGMSPRTLRRCLAHLHLHGWLYYEAARGNGRKADIRVAPRTPDTDCRCPKVARAVATTGGQSCDRLKGDSADSVVPGQRRSSAGGREEGSEGGSGSVRCLLPAQRAGQLAAVPEQETHPQPVMALVRQCDDLPPVDDTDSSADVIPIHRRKYPSTWCPRADALWAAGYDR